MAKPSNGALRLLTTPELIARAKERLALAHTTPGLRTAPMTDYRFAKLTGFRQQTVSQWQSGTTRIGPENAVRFAKLTGLREEYVFACVELEREKDPGVRKVLLAIAQVFSRKAASVMLGLGVGVGMIAAPSPAQAASGTAQAMYIMLTRMNRRWLRTA